MEDLYALPPEEFTAARDRLAREDKAVKALRRPTVSAWVVNTLVRRDAGLLEDLLALGPELAAAQRSGSGGTLRALGEQRRQLVQAVTERAAALSGRALSAAVRAEVEQTLEAALADPASAEAVRSGALVRPLSFAGFGGVDLEGAVADLPPARPRPARKATPRKPDTSAKEAAALQAQGALDDAVQRAEAAGRALEGARTALDRARAEEAGATEAVEQARQALAAAESAASSASHRRVEASEEHRRAEDRARRATEAVGRAQEAAEQARAALDAARRG